MNRTPILLEGWRFLPHSYGMLNQWLILELLRRENVALFMRDVPFDRATWKPTRGLMRPDQEELIAQVAEPAQDRPPAATFRISVPVRLGPARQGRTFVLGTADFGWLPKVMIERQQSLRDAHAGTDVVIVSPSEWSRWGLVRCGADADRVIVARLGVDPESFRPPTASERDRLRRARNWQDRFVFLNVSAMARSKGIDLILKAFARIVPRYDHIWLCLKGIEDLYPSGRWIRRFWFDSLTPAERDICRPRVRYVGSSLSVEALGELYRAADAYVTPYRTEGFNLPALEAVASGLPIICTAGGPTDEFTTGDFARRISGPLVPNGREPEEVAREPNLDELTDAMIEMVENGGLRDRAREAGPRHAHANFTWRHTVDCLLPHMVA